MYSYLLEEMSHFPKSTQDIITKFVRQMGDGGDYANFEEAQDDLYEALYNDPNQDVCAVEKFLGF